jgi:hypothetical protein
MLAGICLQLGDPVELVISGHHLNAILRHNVCLCFLCVGVFRAIYEGRTHSLQNTVCQCEVCKIV